MRTTEARVTDSELDAIQLARGRVPVEEFRLRNDCAICLWLMDRPATPEANDMIRAHILEEHRDEVVLPGS